MNGTEHDSFTRALRFLQYRRLHKWTALVGSVVLAFLIIVLLGLAGLFMAVLVSRGQLDEDDRQAMLLENSDQRKWLDTLVESEPEREQLLQRIREKQGVGLVALGWSAHERRSVWRPFLEAAVEWWPWTHDNYRLMLGLLLLGLLAALARCGLQMLVHWSAAEATLEASTRLRRAVYLQTNRLGSLLLKRQGLTEAVSMFTRHVEAVQEGLYLWLTSRYREPVRLALLLMFAPLVEYGATGGFPWLTLAFACFAGLVWVVGGQLLVWFRQREQFWNQQSAEQLSLLQESLQMMRLVKGYLMESFGLARLERQLAEYERSLKRRLVGEVVYRQTLTLLALVALVVLLFVAGWNILQNQAGLASILTLTVTLGGMYFPVSRMLRQRQQFRRARESAVRLFAYLDQPGEVTESVSARFLEPMRQQLEFEQVTLRVPGEDRRLLDRVSFTVAAGQRVALVGTDRASLYALAYLLARFHDPDEGTIRIDGNNIRRFTLESVRAQIALVLQQGLIFNDTVANNIACGDPAYKLPRVIEAAKIAHAHQFIQELPQGYDTLIGGLGHPLTPFQQFCIGLARAILREPAIVVIEEPPVHLSDEEKSLLEDTYARFLPGRTVFFLPHRFATLRASNLVLFFHQGRLEAMGTHRELLHSNELYRQLCYVEFHLLAEMELPGVASG